MFAQMVNQCSLYIFSANMMVMSVIFLISFSAIIAPSKVVHQNGAALRGRPPPY